MRKGSINQSSCAAARGKARNNLTRGRTKPRARAREE